MFARYLRWKRFSFSGGILFPSFMLLFCSVADYLVKKRQPIFLCLSTLYTSLKQNTMGVIFGNMKYRLRERQNRNKLRAFSLTRVGVPLYYVKISVGLSEVAVYFP